MWHPKGEYSWSHIFPQGILYCVIIITVIMIIVMSLLDFRSKTSCTALTVWTHLANLVACLYVTLCVFCNCLDHRRTLRGPGCHLVFNSLLTWHCICRCHILHFAVCWIVFTFVLYSSQLQLTKVPPFTHALHFYGPFSSDLSLLAKQLWGKCIISVKKCVNY
jgi:hypothetical protein